MNPPARTTWGGGEAAAGLRTAGPDAAGPWGPRGDPPPGAESPLGGQGAPTPAGKVGRSARRQPATRAGPPRSPPARPHHTAPASVRDVPPRRDAARRPAAGACGGGAAAEVGVCEGEKDGGAAQEGSRAGRLRPVPRPPVMGGSDASGGGGHFLLGWMRRSWRRRGGDRSEDGPRRGEVSRGLVPGPSRADPEPRGRRPRGRAAQRATYRPGLAAGSAGAAGPRSVRGAGARSCGGSAGPRG